MHIGLKVYYNVLRHAGCNGSLFVHFDLEPGLGGRQDVHPLWNGRLIDYLDDRTVLFAQFVAVELDLDGIKLYVGIAFRLFEIALIIT